MKACVSFESNFSPSSYIGMVRDPSFKDFMRARQTIQNLKRDSLRPRHEKKEIASSLGPVEYGGQRAGRIPPYPRTLLSPQIRPPNVLQTPLRIRNTNKTTLFKTSLFLDWWFLDLHFGVPLVKIILRLMLVTEKTTYINSKIRNN